MPELEKITPAEDSYYFYLGAEGNLWGSEPCETVNDAIAEFEAEHCIAPDCVIGVLGVDADGAFFGDIVWNVEDRDPDERYTVNDDGEYEELYNDEEDD